MSQMFALRKEDAVREVRAVARVVDGWKEHFKACGVTAGDIDLYAEQIDPPFLRDQLIGFCFSEFSIATPVLKLG